MQPQIIKGQRSAADQIKRAVGEQDRLLHVVFVYTEVITYGLTHAALVKYH